MVRHCKIYLFANRLLRGEKLEVLVRKIREVGRVVLE